MKIGNISINVNEVSKMSLDEFKALIGKKLPNENLKVLHGKIKKEAAGDEIALTERKEQPTSVTKTSDSSN